MALKRSEKVLVGAGMIVGGLALLIGLGLPQWDAFMAANTQIGTLKDELKNLDVQKTSLNAQIALLEKNTAIPPGIEIKMYTEQNREEIIKGMLDQIVGLATGAGNKFISLKPLENVQPILPPPAKTDDAAKSATDPNAPPAPPPAPLLSTFGYEMAIRGSYDHLQQFLKAMAAQKDLLEISGIVLEDEASMTQGKSADGGTDPGHPIRLTAKLRLALQPSTP